MDGFLQALKIQRWDDHRYYHHSRINQALHLVSALSFLTAYVLIFTDPVAAALMGWLVAMTSRQIGHFFFEPKDYDEVNKATHEYKEEIKVGYNLQRKVVLMSIWALSPFPLYFDPTLFGIFEHKDYDDVNKATHEYTEEIKVGYNLQREVVLMSLWALSPFPLYFDPTLFGIFEPHATTGEFIRHVSIVWLVIGLGGLIWRI